MEIEMRAKIKDIDELNKKFNLFKNVQIKSQAERQVDTYIKHSLEKNGLLIIRIRRKKGGAMLSFKTKSADPHGDTSWHDYDTEITEPDKLEDILLSSGYEYVVLIDKVRDSFSWEEFEINIDNIRDLGLFIEIEAQGTEQEIETKKKEIKNIFDKLGISNDDIIEKGYVQLMKEKK